MSSDLKNLSSINFLPDATGLRIGIVVSAWNIEVTEALFLGAKGTLLNAGVKESDIFRQDVPGSFELPLGAKFLLSSLKPDAVVCIGCVIQGETRHFDFICHAVSSGIMQLGLENNTPVIFGVLTTGTLQQAIDRSGGKHGNKGVEAAVTAIQMALIKKKL